MTKRELSRYFWLQHEIRRQKKRLEKLERKQEQAGELVGDSVKDYRTGKGLPLKIQGIAQADIQTPVMIKLLEEEIEKNINESEEAVVRIEQYINGIEEPRMRELLRSRFIDCLPWEEVGKRNYIAPDYARQLITNFIRSMAS